MAKQTMLVASLKGKGVRNQEVKGEAGRGGTCTAPAQRSASAQAAMAGTWRGLSASARMNSSRAAPWLRAFACATAHSCAPRTRQRYVTRVDYLTFTHQAHCKPRNKCQSLTWVGFLPVCSTSLLPKHRHWEEVELE